MPRPKQPAPVKRPPKRPAVADAAPKTASNAIVWANLVALMVHHYGKENQTELARDSKTSPGNIARLKAQQTSVGFEVLEKVAAAFKLHAWQLLVPGLDPTTPPVLRVPSTNERKLYENVKKASEVLTDFLEQANTKPGDL